MVVLTQGKQLDLEGRYQTKFQQKERQIQIKDKKEKHRMKVYQTVMEDTSDEEEAEDNHSEEESKKTP